MRRRSLARALWTRLQRVRTWHLIEFRPGFDRPGCGETIFRFYCSGRVLPLSHVPFVRGRKIARRCPACVAKAKAEKAP